jgi:hypothetical protein
MNDDHNLTIVRDRLAEARDCLGEMPRPRPTSQIIARAGRRRARLRLISAGAVCAAAGLAILAVATGGTGGNSAAQARTVAYVTSRVENALASENLVYMGRSSTIGGDIVTWAYGPRARTEELTTNACGHVTASGACTGRGGSELYLAQGTALAGRKLVGAYVTYFNREYSLSRLGSQPTSACSTNAALAMGSPMVETTHWSAFINATLACGAASVTGHVVIDGVETIRITGKPVTVKLVAGYAKLVHARWATGRWTLYVNPRTYLPVRMYGSTQTFGGSAGASTSSSVTDVRWLPATSANIAKALVAIPPGFHRFYGPAGDQ